MPQCPECQAQLRERELHGDFACPSCGAKLKSNRKGLTIALEIAAVLGGVPLIGWVTQSNNWYLVAAIVYWLILYGLYRSFLQVRSTES